MTDPFLWKSARNQINPRQGRLFSPHQALTGLLWLHNWTRVHGPPDLRSPTAWDLPCQPDLTTAASLKLICHDPSGRTLQIGTTTNAQALMSPTPMSTFRQSRSTMSIREVVHSQSKSMRAGEGLDEPNMPLTHVMSTNPAIWRLDHARNRSQLAWQPEPHPHPWNLVQIAP